MTPVDAFFEAVAHRRTICTLSPETTFPDSEIKEILETTLEQCPSTYGSYTTRLILLVKQEHFQLWDSIAEVQKSAIPLELWESRYKARVDALRNAYGTVMFFEDPENTRVLQKQNPSGEEKFQQWSEHTSAMHQFII